MIVVPIANDSGANCVVKKMTKCSNYVLGFIYGLVITRRFRVSWKKKKIKPAYFGLYKVYVVLGPGGLFWRISFP